MTNNSPSAARNQLQRWAVVLGVLVVLFIVAGLVLPHFLDLDRYRTRIASAIEAQTGRKATLGAIHARFLPAVGFRVDDVGLGNPPGFPEGELIHTETVSARVALWPLLHKRIEVVSLDLVNPRITLLAEPGGRTNYDFSPSGRESKASARPPARSPAGDPPKADESGSSFSLQEIAEFSLTSAEVVLADVVRDRVQPSTSVHGLNLQAHTLAFGPFMAKQLEGVANLKGVRIESSSLAEPLVVQSGQITVQQGRAQGSLLVQLGKALNLKGALSVVDLDRPVLDFDISTPQLDIDALSKLFSSGSTVAHDPPVASAKAPAPSQKSALLAQGRLSADRISFGLYTANNALASVRLYADRIEVFPAHMALYGGTLQVALRADRTQTPLRFSANVKLNDIDIHKLVSTDRALKGKMDGTGELNLEDVSGSAGANLLDSLNGKGSFAVRNGQLLGVDLPSKLESAMKFVGAGSTGSATTPFNVIQGDLTIAGGRVSSKQIHMDSPLGTVDLSGSFGFNQSVSYTGQATLLLGAGGGAQGGVEQPAVGALAGLMGRAGGRNISSLTIPFTLSGAFSHLKVRPGKALPKSATATSGPAATAPQQEPSLTNTPKSLFGQP
jgi:uncharacterized protein involved in outer membrane biogenesis